MDKTNKEKILNALEVLRIRDLQNGEKFCALAYTKAIKELKKLDIIESVKDVEGVSGVGKKIKEKVKEIIETGGLEAATKAMKDLKIDVYQDLLKVHGIGPAKAKELIEKHNISSIEDLRKNEDLLNEIQKKGMKYYEDSLERIPRFEMEEHEKKIMEKVKTPFEAKIVGSFRRGLESSGDIDVLIKAPESYNKKKIKEFFESLMKQYEDEGYLIDILALGEKKCMGYVKLKSSNKARRLDILITPEKEYPYAILYFTGSDDFNVAFRKYALSKGYTLNEHTMKITKLTKLDVKDIPEVKTEKDIFNFIGLKYKEPKDRIDASSIVKKITLKNIIGKQNTITM